MRRTLVVLLALIVTASSWAADTPIREIRELYSSLQLDQRFAEKRASYLDFMRHQDSSPAFNRVVSYIGDKVLASDYRDRICAYLATQFSAADAAMITGYLATPAGRSEFDEARSLVKEAEASPPGSIDIEAKRDAFFRSLTPDERKTIDRFHDTSVGQRFWNRMGSVDAKVGEIFQQIVDEIVRQHIPARAPASG